MSALETGVSVVIPVYNALGAVEGLLDSLLALQARSGGQLEIIVGDDASPDGSAAALAAQYPSIRVLAGERNLGYGGNMQRGVQAATQPLLACVNSDAELPGDPFPELAATLAQRPDCFAAMPLIFNSALDKVENLARLYCQRGLCWHTELPAEPALSAQCRELLAAGAAAAAQAAQSGPLDANTLLLAANGSLEPLATVLCGAFFICRREQFNELGGFDARYRPFYWEDVDLGYRALRQGQVCLTNPRAVVLHRHSETINREHGARKLHYLRLNQMRFVQAHADQLRAAGLRHERAWWLARAGRELFAGDRELMRAYWRAGLRRENS